MKNAIGKYVVLCSVLCLAVFWSSCQDNLEYYDTPDSLKGSIYETLQERGNYSIFLKGVDMAGYAPILQGKGVYTVMAPNDEAFTAYLKNERGVNSIEELSSEELQKLIGFHILYYSFDKNKLVNFRPNEGDGATDDQLMVNAGLYYKFRTKSQDAPTIEVVNDTTGLEGSVYHLERFLPVFSYRMFQTKLIDAKYNYEYFYPNSQWTGADGFNVSNASVNEYSIVTSTGYVYLINQVLEPLETIYTELDKNGNYNRFLSFYDEYSYYAKDEALTLDYGNGNDLYQHYHMAPMASIASEWPVTDYTQIASLSSVSYSIFAPTDEAFDDFYVEYFGAEGTGYPAEVTWDSIKPSVIQDILLNSVYASSIVFPEEIKRGDIKNTSGMIIDFDVDAVPVENRKVCVNGVLYGCDVLTPPAQYSAVTGPAYQYKKFNNFLVMLGNSDLISTLCSDEMNYIVLFPSDNQMAYNGIVFDPDDNRLEINNSNLSSSVQQQMVYAHVVSLDGSTTSLTELPLSGNHVFKTLSPDYKLYWYVKDGKITNSFLFNNLINYTGNATTEADVYCEFEELKYRGEDWTNGRCYSYDGTRAQKLFEGSLNNALYANFVPMMYSLRNDETTLFNAFINLLMKGEMIDEESQAIPLMTEGCLMFIPTNAAVKQAIVAGKVPGITTTATADASTADFFAATTVTDLLALQNYLKVYFVPFSTAVISNFPFLGWGEDTEAEGGLVTLNSWLEIQDGVMVTEAIHLNVYDKGTTMTVKVAEDGYNGEVEILGDYDYFPFVFDDGCVHFINGVL